MAGWRGWWKLSIAWALVGACQRLEYVDGDDLDEASDDDAGAEWNVPPDQEDELDEEPPMPVWEPVCVVEERCECYGAPEQTFCERNVHERCTQVSGCAESDPAWREDCIVGILCDAGGHLEGDLLVCDPPATCAGACDLDPTACDTDGDGTLTFACGPNGECVLGQFCVEHGDDWNCDENCSNCSHSEGGWECVSPSGTCVAGTLHEQRQCIGELQCEFWVDSYWGHEIDCGDNECHG